MRERVPKCKVAKSILDMWPKTLFCGEFSVASWHALISLKSWQRTIIVEKW
jgi:hypothetical protein